MEMVINTGECSQTPTLPGHIINNKQKWNILFKFGTTPFVKEQMISDLANKPFSFKFDEITTTRIKKQYEADVTYFLYVT